MEDRNHQHLFPIINVMIDQAVDEVREDGKEVTCQKGCDHCCHLLIEVSWEEAKELAYWIADQAPERQATVISRLKTNAVEAKELFLRRKDAAKFSRPVTGEVEIPEELYDDYFYEKKRGCPFLEDSVCSAYEARPTACRLHMVSSDPELCSKDVTDEEDYEVPDSVEQLKEDVAPMITALEIDGRWGHFGIVLESVLDEMVEIGELLSREEGGNQHFILNPEFGYGPQSKACVEGAGVV